MPPVSSRTDMAAPALVLTSTELWRHISSFQRGLPLPLYEFWLAHVPSRKPEFTDFGMSRLASLVAQHGSLRLLELLCHVKCMQCGFFGYQYEWLSAEQHVRWEDAVSANRADVLEFVIRHNGNPRERTTAWYQATRSYQPGDFRVFDVLYTHCPLAAGELECLPNLTDIRLIRWLGEHFPSEGFSPYILSSAATSGCEDIVRFLLEEHPTPTALGSPTAMFSTIVKRRYYWIIQRLLEKKPQIAEAEMIREMMDTGDDRMMQILQDVRSSVPVVGKVTTNLLLAKKFDVVEKLLGKPLSRKEFANRADIKQFLREEGFAA